MSTTPINPPTRLWPVRNFSAMAAAAIAVLLAGCALAGIRVNQDIAHQYSTSTLGRVATGDRQLKVDIRQKPFAMPDDRFGAIAIAGMQNRTPGAQINFSLNPENSYRNNSYRTVLLFNPPPRTSSIGLCKPAKLDALAPPGPLRYVDGADEVRLVGAYCNGDLTLSRVSARALAVDGPNSEKFDQLMSQVALALFPSRNPHLDRDDCRF
ncbi:MAG: hypothetical protein ACTSX7_07880, partial [Alphaproteobacteria bacterium]